MTLPARALLILCALAAWAMGRRMRALAVTLSALVVLDIVWAYAGAALPPTGPFTGRARLLFHAQQTAVLGWSGVVAAGVVATLNSEPGSESNGQPHGASRSAVTTPSTSRPHAVRGFTGLAARMMLRSPVVKVALVYTAAWLACVALYPWLRGAPLFDVYRASRVLAVVIIGAALVVRARRPAPAEVPALLLAAGHAAQLFGPWLAGEPVRDWALATFVSSLTYAAILLALGVLWILARRRRDTH